MSGLSIIPQDSWHRTWVRGPLCTDQIDTACVEMCPVDCIHLYTGNDPAIPKNQLLIDPAEWIDCAACEPACPWEAIYQDAEVPEEFKEFVEINGRITGQAEIERTPEYDKPKPTPQEVMENREKWFVAHRRAELATAQSGIDTRVS